QDARARLSPLSLHDALPICDRLLVEKSLDRFRSRRHSGDIDARSPVAEVAVGLWNVCQPISLQHLSYAGGVPLLHFEDAQSELHVDLLLAAELSEKSMLRRARATTLAQHAPEFSPIRDTPIGQLPDMACRPHEVEC